MGDKSSDNVHVIKLGVDEIRINFFDLKKGLVSFSIDDDMFFFFNNYSDDCIPKMGYMCYDRIVINSNFEEYVKKLGNINRIDFLDEGVYICFDKKCMFIDGDSDYILCSDSEDDLMSFLATGGETKTETETENDCTDDCINNRINFFNSN